LAAIAAIRRRLAGRRRRRGGIGACPDSRRHIQCVRPNLDAVCSKHTKKIFSPSAAPSGQRKAGTLLDATASHRREIGLREICRNITGNR
jgi:hypothetical protein